MFLPLCTAIAGLILFLSPLLDATWDVWAKTIVYILAVMLFVSALFLSGRPLKSHAAGTLPVFLFFLWLLLSSLVSPVRFSSELEFAGWITCFLVFLSLRAVFPDGGRNHPGVFKYAVLCGFALVLAGFFQYFVRKEAPCATMLNVNIFAGYLIMVLPLMLLSASRTYEGIRKTSGAGVPYGKYALFLLCGFLAASSIVLLFIIKSLSAILSVLFAALIARFGWKGLALSVVIGIAAIYASLGNVALTDRLSWWQSAAGMIRDYPLFGAGPGNFELAYPAYRGVPMASLYAHSFYLQLAAETGVLGLLLFVLAVAGLAARIQNRFVLAGVIAILIQNIFDYNLQIPANGILFWSMLSTAVLPGETGTEEKYRGGTGIPGVILAVLLVISAAGMIKTYSAVRSYNEAEKLSAETPAGASDKAEKAFLKAVALQKNFWHAYGGLGKLYEGKYKTEKKLPLARKAIDSFEKGVHYNPFAHEYYFMLAKLHNAAGNRASASEYIKKAAKYDIFHAQYYGRWAETNIR